MHGLLRLVVLLQLSQFLHHLLFLHGQLVLHKLDLVLDFFLRSLAFFEKFVLHLDSSKLHLTILVIFGSLSLHLHRFVISLSINNILLCLEILLLDHLKSFHTLVLSHNFILDFSSFILLFLHAFELSPLLSDILFHLYLLFFIQSLLGPLNLQLLQSLIIFLLISSHFFDPFCLFPSVFLLPILHSILFLLGFLSSLTLFGIILSHLRLKVSFLVSILFELKIVGPYSCSLSLLLQILFKFVYLFLFLTDTCVLPVLGHLYSRRLDKIAICCSFL